MLAFILAYKACFAMSVGPVTWVILSEIFPTGIRGRAMAMATVCLWVANYVVIQTFPMMDETRWLSSRSTTRFPFWLYAVFCVVSVAFRLAVRARDQGQDAGRDRAGMAEGQRRVQCSLRQGLKRRQ